MAIDYRRIPCLSKSPGGGFSDVRVGKSVLKTASPCGGWCQKKKLQNIQPWMAGPHEPPALHLKKMAGTSTSASTSLSSSSSQTSGQHNYTRQYQQCLVGAIANIPWAAARQWGYLDGLAQKKNDWALGFRGYKPFTIGWRMYEGTSHHYAQPLTMSGIILSRKNLLMFL